MSKKPTVAEQLRELAAKAQKMSQKAADTAEIVSAGREYNPDTMAQLARVAKLDKKSSDVFGKLLKARQAAENDALVRHSVLVQEIDHLYGQEHPDIMKFLELVEAAVATHLANKKPAVPILTRTNHEGIRQWSNQHLVMPRAFLNEGGHIRHGGVDFLIPASHADAATVIKLRELKERCYQSLMSELQNELVPNLKFALLHGIIFVGLASVMIDDLFAKHFEVTEGSRIAKRKPEQGRRKDNRSYETFRFGRTVFFAPVSDASTAFVGALEQAQKRLDKFWNGETDDERAMSQIVIGYQEDAGELISPKHFLDGLCGATAVAFDTWNIGYGKTARVFMFLEREEVTNRWRWLYANPNAVRHFFGGRKMYYHEWSTYGLPDVVEKILRHGYAYQPIDLTDDTVEEVASDTLEAEEPIETGAEEVVEVEETETQGEMPPTA